MWCFKSPFLLVRSHFVLVTYLFLRVKLPFLSVKSPNFCGWNPRLPMPLSWKKFFHVQVHWAGLGDRRKVIWTAGWTAGLEKLGIGPRENGIINGRKRDFCGIVHGISMEEQWTIHEILILLHGRFMDLPIYPPVKCSTGNSTTKRT